MQIYIAFQYIISNFLNLFLVFQRCFDKGGSNFDDFTSVRQMV